MALGGGDAKPGGSAPNVKSDYRPSGESGPAVPPKMGATKNAGRAENTIASVKASGTTAVAAATDPLDVISFGAADAPLTIIEYGSFTCSHCGEFAQVEFPKIKEAYIDKGLVKLVFRPMSRNGIDVQAGLLVTCLQPERRGPMVELLFKQQQKWIPFDTPEDKIKDVLITNLKGYGRNAGLTDQSVDQCLVNKQNQTWLQAVLSQANKDGVEGTPTFFINGKKYSNMAFEDWQKTIDPLLPKTN